MLSTVLKIDVVNIEYKKLVKQGYDIREGYRSLFIQLISLYPVEFIEYEGVFYNTVKNVISRKDFSLKSCTHNTIQFIEYLQDKQKGE